MKEIKIINLKVSDKIPTNRIEFLKSILENVPIGKGVSTGEMRQKFKVIDKLDDSKDEVILNMEEFNILLKNYKEIQWNIVDKGIIELEDYLESLK